MFDPITMMYYSRLRQKENFDSIYGVHQTEAFFGLYDALAGLWLRLDSPPKQAQGWQPTRTVRT